MCICACLCVAMCKWVQEGAGSLGAGVIGGCEPPGISAENQLTSSTTAVCTLTAESTLKPHIYLIFTYLLLGSMSMYTYYVHARELWVLILFYHVGPRAWLRSSGLAAKHLYVLSYLASPMNVILISISMKSVGILEHSFVNTSVPKYKHISSRIQVRNI